MHCGHLFFFCRKSGDMSGKEKGMDIGMETSVFLAYTAGMLLLYFFGRIFFIPIKMLLKLLLCSVVGGAVLVLLHIFGAKWGLTLPANPVNAVIAGATGVPGVVGLLLYFNL